MWRRSPFLLVALVACLAVISMVNASPKVAGKHTQDFQHPSLGHYYPPEDTRHSSGPTRRQLWGLNKSPVTYHNGEVMTNPVNVYLIYIGFNSNDLVPKWLSYFTYYLSGTNFWRTTKKYYKVINNQRVYVNGAINLKASWYYPATFQREYNVPNMVDTSGWSSTNEATTVRQFVSKAIALNNQVVAKDDIYVLITAKGVIKRPTCDQRPSLGWHTYMTTSTGVWPKIIFVPQDDCGSFTAPGPTPGTVVRRNGMAPVGYDPSKSPTGSGVIDGLMSSLAHELAETVTDPEMGGWYGASYTEEPTDNCVGYYRYKLFEGKDSYGRVIQYTDMLGSTGVFLPLNYDITVDPKTNWQVGCVFGTDANNQPLLTYSTNVKYVWA